MGFVFMVLHWPEPGESNRLARGMAEMRSAMEQLPGCIGVDPPLVTADGTCLVGISRWTSKQAFLDAGITLRGEDEIVEGEVRPRLRLLLEEAG